MNRKTFLQSISAAIVGFFGVKAAKEVPAWKKANPALIKYPEVWSVKGKALVFNKPDSNGDVFAPGCIKNWDEMSGRVFFNHDPKMTYKHIEGDFNSVSFHPPTELYIGHWGVFKDISQVK